jgi:DNA-binding XRE family transcriptional regulator
MADAKDRILGKRGSPRRELYEAELKVEMLGSAIRNIRKEQNLSQAELGEKLGISKYQISRIEKDTTTVNVQTLLKVFGALGREISININ